MAGPPVVTFARSGERGEFLYCELGVGSPAKVDIGSRVCYEDIAIADLAVRVIEYVLVLLRGATAPGVSIFSW